MRRAPGTGDGGTQWRATPRLRADLHVTYTDGTEDVIASDASWKASVNGPTRYDSYYLGETYDARRDLPPNTFSARDMVTPCGSAHLWHHRGARPCVRLHGRIGLGRHKSKTPASTESNSSE